MKIPKEAPSWIKHWPSPHTIITLYQHGVKVSYTKNKNAFDYSLFDWDESGVRLAIDRFKCSWQWNGLVWSQKCNCNFPGGKCIHTYALAMKMNEYVRINNFLQDDKEISNTASQVKFVQEKRHISSSNVTNIHSRELVVEADFKTSSSEILLRFYSVENDMRNLMKLSLLRNICAVAGYGAGSRNVWNVRDLEFMSWLHPYFREISNLELEKWTAMKVSKKRFDQWLVHWRDIQPGRFIERDSNQALTCGDNTIKLFFELQAVEDRTRIDCVAVFPDGKRVFFHELAKQMQRQSKQEVVDLDKEYVFYGAISRFDFPISSRQIWDLFSKKNPSIATEALSPNLPVLLEKRLDLVSGDIVKKNVILADVELMLRFDRGKLIFTPSYKGKSIDEVSSIKKTGDFFEIEVYEFNNLDALKIYLRSFGYNGSHAVMEINSNNLSMLAKLWEDRPNVYLDCDLESANLLTPQVPEIKIDAIQSGNWLNLSTTWELGENYSFYSENINNALRSGQEFVRSKEGKWLRLDLNALVAGHQTLLEKGIEHGASRRVLSDAVKMLQRTEFRRMLSDTARFTLDNIEQRLLPDFDYGSNFQAILRPYQLEGFAFLKEMTRYGIGCVLADDMGLGKTVQILAVISGLKKFNQGPTLVCAPASVLNVWKNEVRKFAPDLRVEICHGSVSKREQMIKNAKSYDLLITSYGSARNDSSLLAETEFALLILDEAQYIRNPQTLTYEAILKLKSRMRIAVTGTPVENRATDLWSIIHFTNPGFLGPLDQFKSVFESKDQLERRKELASRVAPLLLRRTKEVVASDLPPKTVEVLSVEMSAGQRNVYAGELSKLAAFCANRSNTNRIELLAHLTRLRQICCSPELLGVQAPSAKLDRMIEMLVELHEEGHSALVFSSFTSMLDLVAERLCKEGIEYFTITGKTPVSQRSKLVDEFNNSPNNAMFLLSLKAAGTGLTLTKADYVFIFDPWWNPAAEAQAIDRTHRIGQDKPVIAYKMVAEDSIEEQILLLQEQKKELFDQLVSDTDAVPQEINSEFISKLLRFEE